ncbi:MAG: BrnT family toxin [bacterium]|nr:BrnT family toxin [bacterium]
MLVFRKPLAFEWDRGNRGKNERRHGVTDGECEEVFFDSRKRILHDALHSGAEERYLLIGATQAQRVLFIVFTMRSHWIRIISARDLNRKERHLYGKAA